jgi:ribosome-binding protein aMBF1 (putative translation factor)
VEILHTAETPVPIRSISFHSIGFGNGPALDVDPDPLGFRGGLGAARGCFRLGLEKQMILADSMADLPMFMVRAERLARCGRCCQRGGIEVNPPNAGVLHLSNGGLGSETRRREAIMNTKRAKPVKQRGPRATGPIDKYFGDRMRARRLMIEMSQVDLGKSLGLSFQQIQKYERGENRISAALMARMIEILDVNIGYFFDEIPKTKRIG